MPRDSMSRPASGSGRLSEIQRRVVIFSVLGVLGLLVVLAIFEPRGMESARAAAQKLLWRVGPVDQIGWRQAPALMAAGLAAGFLAGMLGMGGGVLKVSCMLLVFNFDIFFSRAISIVTMFFSSSSALWHHLKNQTVTWRYAGPMVLLSLPGVIVGGLVGNSLGGSALTHVFGVFLVFLSFNTLAWTFDDPNDQALEEAFRPEPEGRDGYRCGAIGALHGAVCGLLGISGGVIATPLQQVLLHMPTRNAIANTLLVSTVVTSLGSLFVVWTGVARGDFGLSQVSFVTTFMGGAAIFGARLGAQLGATCNVTVLRLAFAALTFAAGLWILF
jgi:uncharacterized membrane protein YfcA